MNFQAEGFYIKQGYERIGELKKLLIRWYKIIFAKAVTRNRVISSNGKVITSLNDRIKIEDKIYTIS